MASLVYARRAKASLERSGSVHTDFKKFNEEPLRLLARVTALTRVGPVFLVLLALVALLWGAVKILQWNRFGGFFLTRFDAGLGIIVLLASTISFYHVGHRRILKRGALHSARVLTREKGTVQELTADAGEARPRTALAGDIPTGLGISRFRMLSVEYEIDGVRYVGAGQLLPGDLPALVPVDGKIGFAVLCDPRRPRRAVLVTEYDYQAVPGEAE